MTDVNRNQRNTRESRKGQQHQESLPIRRDGEKVRHAQERNEDRRGRKLDYDVEKRRANNEYLVHERMGRRVRSNHGGNRSRKDYGVEELASSLRRSAELQDLMRERTLRTRARMSSDYYYEQRAMESSWSVTRRSRAVEHEPARERAARDTRRAENLIGRDIGEIVGTSERTTKAAGTTTRIAEVIGNAATANGTRRYHAIEDFQPDANDVGALGRFWAADPDDAWTYGALQIQDDYFGDYLESGESPPRKRSPGSPVDKGMTYKDLLRMKRELEDRDDDTTTTERREKRDEDDSRCNSEVTTLTVGCSTADRMEFQSDCVDDDATTGNYLTFSTPLYGHTRCVSPRRTSFVTLKRERSNVGGSIFSFARHRARM